MSSREKDQEIASVTFTVAVPEHTAALILTKKIFAPNEEIKLDFEASPLLPKNTWVGLIPKIFPMVPRPAMISTTAPFKRSMAGPRVRWCSGHRPR